MSIPRLSLSPLTLTSPETWHMLAPSAVPPVIEYEILVTIHRTLFEDSNLKWADPFFSKVMMRDNPGAQNTPPRGTLTDPGARRRI